MSSLSPCRKRYSLSRNETNHNDRLAISAKTENLEASSWMSLDLGARKRERERRHLTPSIRVAAADCRRRWRPAAARVNVGTSTGDAVEDDGEQKGRMKKRERERGREGAFPRRDSRTGARHPAVSTDLSHASLSLSRLSTYLPPTLARFRACALSLLPPLSPSVPRALDNVVATAAATPATPIVFLVARGHSPLHSSRAKRYNDSANRSRARWSGAYMAPNGGFRQHTERTALPLDAKH